MKYSHSSGVAWKAKFWRTDGVLSKLPGPKGIFSGVWVGVMKIRSPLAVMVASFAPRAETCWSEIDQVENAMAATDLL